MGISKDASYVSQRDGFVWNLKRLLQDKVHYLYWPYENILLQTHTFIRYIESHKSFSTRMRENFQAMIKFFFRVCFCVEMHFESGSAKASRP